MYVCIYVCMYVCMYVECDQACRYVGYVFRSLWPISTYIADVIYRGIYSV